MCDTDIESALAANVHNNLNELYRNPTAEQEAVILVLGLSGSEIRAYVALVKHPDSTAEHLANVLDRHRRHVARSLRELHDDGLVKRREKTFDKGGKGFIYSPIPVEKTKQYFQTQLQNWLDGVRDELETIDHRLEEGTNSFDCSHGSPEGES